MNKQAEKRWRSAFEARLMERGVDRDDAYCCGEAAEYDPDIDPKEAADDELSEWAANALEEGETDECARE